MAYESYRSSCPFFPFFVRLFLYRPIVPLLLIWLYLPIKQAYLNCTWKHLGIIYVHHARKAFLFTWIIKLHGTIIHSALVSPFIWIADLIFKRNWTRRKPTFAPLYPPCPNINGKIKKKNENKRHKSGKKKPVADGISENVGWHGEGKSFSDVYGPNHDTFVTYMVVE